MVAGSFIVALERYFRLKLSESRPAITCSKLTIETLDQGVIRRSGVFIVNFEHNIHFVPVLLLLTLSR